MTLITSRCRDNSMLHTSICQLILLGGTAAPMAACVRQPGGASTYSCVASYGSMTAASSFFSSRM
jgi:hypothetical protein